MTWTVIDGRDNLILEFKLSCIYICIQVEQRIVVVAMFPAEIKPSQMALGILHFGSVVLELSFVPPFLIPHESVIKPFHFFLYRVAHMCQSRSVQ